jgi:hypothetical protein
MAAQMKAIGTQARSNRSRALRARRLTESNSRRLDILGCPVEVCETLYHNIHTMGEFCR